MSIDPASGVALLVLCCYLVGRVTWLVANRSRETRQG